MSDLLSLMGELFALKQNQRTHLAYDLLGALRPGWVRLGEVGNLHEISLQVAKSNVKIFGNLNRYKRTSGYYRQSEVGNMFFRYKNLIGDELRARNENSRRVVSVIACNILNRLKLLGSPQSELIA